MPSSPIYLSSSLILSYQLCIFLPCGLAIRGYPQILCTHLSSPHTCHMPSLSNCPSFDHLQNIMVRSTDHEPPHYSYLHLILLPQAIIFSSAPYSQTPLAHDLPIMRHTVSHPQRTKGKTYFIYLNLHTFKTYSQLNKF